MFTWNELATMTTLIGCFAAAFTYLSRQFSNTNSLVYRKADDLRQTFLDKLDYHERHDDVRFDNMRKDIYQLGIRLAAKSGQINGEQ